MGPSVRSFRAARTHPVFWVHINENSVRAKIHRPNCKYCVNGTGPGLPRLKRKGTWHGPFDTYDHAFWFGENTTRGQGVTRGYGNEWGRSIDGYNAYSPY
jgi:hypothetical protein